MDIKSRTIRPFSRVPRVINLASRRVIHIPITRIAKGLFIALGIFYFAFGSVLMAPVVAQNDAEREALERRYAELEQEMEQHQAKISRLRAEGNGLQGEIDALNAKIGKINLQIKSITLSLARLEGEIQETTSEIDIAEQRMQLARRALIESLRKLYENDRQGLIVMLLRNEQFSAFFGDVNNLLEVQDTLSLTVAEITALRTELLDRNETLAFQKNDAVALKAFQDSQRAAISNVKKEKANLLDVTKGEEARYQELLKETQKTAAEIRQRIFQLVGGGELTFEEAYNIALLAQKATGIRAAMVLAILDRESRFGQNVGRCDYQDAMHPTRDLPVFLEIIADLKAAGVAPPEPIQVSCPISAHGAYGGAMGPAQFIPSTWKIYDGKISGVTGNSPASPWNNSDALVGTALYLKDAYNSQSCRTYAAEGHAAYPELSLQFLQERCAAAKYYAGGRWYRHRFFYGDPVVERANAFEEDIAILNS